jgi:hypothetical protein
VSDQSRVLAVEERFVDAVRFAAVNGYKVVGAMIIKSLHPIYYAFLGRFVSGFRAGMRRESVPYFLTTSTFAGRLSPEATSPGPRFVGRGDHVLTVSEEVAGSLEPKVPIPDGRSDGAYTPEALGRTGNLELL